MHHILTGSLFAIGLFSGFGHLAAAQTALMQGSAAATVVAPRLQFSSDEMALAELVSSDPVLAEFYGGNGLRKVFDDVAGQTRRQAVRDMVLQMPAHGLPEARYWIGVAETANDLRSELAYARSLARMIGDLSGGAIDPASANLQIYRRKSDAGVAEQMRAFVESDDPAAYLGQVGPRSTAYLRLKDELSQQRRLVADPSLPLIAEAVWREGANDAAVVDLRRRLASIGFDAGDLQAPFFDPALTQTVTAFQEAAGLTADGVAGPVTVRRLNSDGESPQSRAVTVALERLRWLGQEDLSARHVWVNIPEYSASIIDKGAEVFKTRVVVGKTDIDLRTPEFSDEMEYVVVNPRWNVPRSITVKEYLPKLQANPNAVSHIDIVDGRGDVVPRGSINFAKYTAKNFPYRMQQQPSGDNALGLVKFIFPNRWNIYLHDTPSKHLFASQTRAYSHGCVRIGDPFDLAYALLSRQYSDPRAVFQRALDSGKERYLQLEPVVPVHLVYFTAYPDESGRIRYFNDIYGRDAAIWNKLQQAGLETGT